MKLTRRKGFNFYRSYFDIFNQLPEDDKLKFIQALLDKQFLGVEPEGLDGISKFAYLSQKHSIDKQIKGFQDKTGIILSDNQLDKDPSQGCSEHPTKDPSQQVQVEVQVQGEVQDSVVDPITKFTDWFNTRRTQYLEIDSNFKRLSYQDKKNLDQLKELYEHKDFEKVILNMSNDKYCNENKRIIPSHFLEYFENYISIDSIPLISKKQKTIRGWKS